MYIHCARMHMRCTYVHICMRVLVAQSVYLFANIANLYNAPSGCDDVLMFILRECIFSSVRINLKLHKYMYTIRMVIVQSLCKI